MVSENGRGEAGGTVIDCLGLILIGLLSLGFTTFYIQFAKLHVDQGCIKAPLFIGDMVFTICFLLFSAKSLMIRRKPDIVTYLFLAYMAFIFLKTVTGYLSWGALALRHSVLFLYPLFACFSYVFYRKEYFNTRMSLFILLIFFTVFLSNKLNSRFAFTYITLTILLINADPRRAARYLLYLLLLISAPFKDVIATGRTFLISNVSAVVYVFSGYLYLLRIRVIYKFMFCLLFILSIFYALEKLPVRSELRGMVDIEELRKRHNLQMELFNIKEPSFVRPDLGVSLYNEARDTVQRSHLSDKLGGMDNSKYEGGINRINAPYGNVLFRLFVWKDALKELSRYRPVFGFDFGKPFRSHMLEVRGWAECEWRRDGWICMHNSYLDIAYRAGLIGIIFIGVMFSIVFKCIVNSFRKRSISGILLSGVLINWLVAANFSEVFEMPYFAIPMWSLFGLTYAYLFKYKERNEDLNYT